ncbi:hypothetical protein TRVA0_031S01156 [Trichomonascus vanleenenianus]|uniref:uncharacterized protein n=1 Tax=Trichomonascus vanleenenianus TaxID=2268995 RepID=UPI003ECB0437
MFYESQQTISPPRSFDDSGNPVTPKKRLINVTEVPSSSPRPSPLKKARQRPALGDENIQSRYEISQSYDTDISPAKTVSSSGDDEIGEDVARKLDFSQSNKENRPPIGEDDLATPENVGGLELSDELSEVDSIASSQIFENSDLGVEKGQSEHAEDDDSISVIEIDYGSPRKESLYADLTGEESSSSQDDYGIARLIEEEEDEDEEEVHCAQPKSPPTQYWESVESIDTESKNSAKSTPELTNDDKRKRDNICGKGDSVFTKPVSTVSMASSVSLAKPLSRSSSISVISSSSRENSNIRETLNTREDSTTEHASTENTRKNQGIQIRESIYESTQYAQTDSMRMPPSQEEEIPGSQWWENDEAEIPDTSQEGLSSQSVYYDTIERVLDTDTEEMCSDARAVKSHSMSNGDEESQ